MAETLPPGIDMSRPNVARVYDYLLDGKDNFSSDGELAEHLLGIVPGMRESARDNRAFVCAAVARAAENGVTQFLDLGAGLPTHPATHEAAREINPDEGTTTTLQPAYTAAETFRHSVADFTSFFAGTDIVPPGIAEARRWIAGVSAPPPKHGVYVLAGTGVKR